MKILVGLSGGVDSSAAAAYLLEQGYEVGGAYMRMYPGAGKMADSTDAQNVAAKLGIPFYELDMEDTFRREVLDYFTRSYQQGLTPNPCVRCNQTMKFGAFLRAAQDLGYDKIATGHYAKIVQGADGLYRLQRSGNRQKDQSYFLYHLNQDQLSRTIFPLEDGGKEETRDRARTLGLDVAEKKDSQDICFVEQGQYVEFIETYTGSPLIPGDFVDTQGNYLGRHKGIERYTIGQRKGVETAFGRPLYVVSKDAATRQVVMGENQDLMTDGLAAKHFTLHPDYQTQIRQGNFPCTAKHRYGQKETPVTVSMGDHGQSLCVHFDTPQRAVTPGQTVVLYDGDTVVGGGEISEQ